MQGELTWNKAVKRSHDDIIMESMKTEQHCRYQEHIFSNSHDKVVHIQFSLLYSKHVFR